MSSTAMYLHAPTRTRTDVCRLVGLAAIWWSMAASGNKLNKIVRSSRWGWKKSGPTAALKGKKKAVTSFVCSMSLSTASIHPPTHHIQVRQNAHPTGTHHGQSVCPTRVSICARHTRHAYPMHIHGCPTRIPWLYPPHAPCSERTQHTYDADPIGVPVLFMRTRHAYPTCVPVLFVRTQHTVRTGTFAILYPIRIEFAEKHVFITLKIR